MIIKGDGQKINIQFSQEISGNILVGGNSRWKPSSFSIEFNIPSYAPSGTLNSKNLVPTEVIYAPVYDGFQSLNSSSSASGIEIFDAKVSSGITQSIIFLEFISDI